MTQILVHSYTKEYPDFYKIINYSYPRLVGKSEDIFDHDPFKYYDVLDINHFYRDVPKNIRNIKDIFCPPVVKMINPPVINSSFPFLNDQRSLMLWDIYQSQLRDINRPKLSSSLQTSVRRSKRIIKDLIACNEFDMWVTFTFKVQLFDIDLAKKRISQWLKDQQKQYGDFGYLVVPEYHKSGAVHFHALLSGYSGVVAPALSPKSGRQIIKAGRKIFNIVSYNRGFTQMEYIDSTLAVSRYISKYITKDTPVLAGKRRFFHSKGLKKPLCTANHRLAGHNAKTLFFKNDSFSISYLAKNSIKNNCSLDLSDIPF